MYNSEIPCTIRPERLFEKTQTLREKRKKSCKKMLSVFKKNEKSLFPVRIVLFSECPLSEKDCVPKTETARYMKMHV